MFNQHTSRASQLRLALLLFAFALLLAGASCGGRRTLTSQDATPRPFIAEDAVAQALALQPPKGVDPAVFNKLRDELVRQLRQDDDGKLASAAPLNAGCQVRDLAYDAGTGELTWSYANNGDYNLDGSVGVADITPLALYFGANTQDGLGNDAYEAWLDGDGNHVIGIGDITPLAMGFGSEVAGYNVTCANAVDGEYSTIGAVSFSEQVVGIPPGFTFTDASLPAQGMFCEVRPVDSLNEDGVESLPLSLVTGHTVIAEGTIGPAGGSIGNGSVIVDVQAGTFSADTTLTIEGAPTDRYEDTASGAYYIEGLPDTFSAPITFRIKMTELPEPGSECLLAFEEGSVFLYGQGTTGREAEYFPGAAEDGWFTATIPATSNDLGTSSLRNTSAETDKTVYVTVINRRHYLMSNSGRFLVYFPAADEVLASTVADAMDEAYTKIEALGLSWARRTTWPLEVTIRIMGSSSVDGEMLSSRLWGVNGATITINSTNMISNDFARATAGHELLHVAQYLYDKRNRVSSALSGGGWLWMDEACSVWFERQMTPSSYIPNIADANRDFIEEALNTDTQAHGYGASMFLTDLANRQGNAIIGSIISKKWDNNAPIDAVKNATANLIEFDWSYFCESFLKLGVYGTDTYPSLAVIDSMQRGSFDFDTYYSTGTTFTWTGAPDLTARVYKVKFEPTGGWRASDELAITLFGSDPKTPPADSCFVVCKYVNSTWSFVVNSSQNEYVMKDIKSVADAGGVLFIMVANERAQSPYTGTRPDSINLKVEPKEDFLARLQMNNDLRLANSAWAAEHSSLGEDTEGQWWLDGTMKTIVWNGTSFHTSHETMSGEDDLYAEGTVDPVAKTVTLTYTYSWQSSTNQDSSSGGYTITNFPIDDSTVNGYPSVEGLLIGPECEPHMSGVSYGGHMDAAPAFDFWRSDFSWNDDLYSSVWVCFMTGL
jgi:hypothetical protein